MNSKSFALALLLLGLIAVIHATPGKVYINGQCVDCNKPDNDDSVIIPNQHPHKSGGMSYSLTSGAALFGIASYFLSAFL